MHSSVSPAAFPSLRLLGTSFVPRRHYLIYVVAFLSINVPHLPNPPSSLRNQCNQRMHEHPAVQIFVRQPPLGPLLPPLLNMMSFIVGETSCAALTYDTGLPSTSLPVSPSLRFSSWLGGWVEWWCAGCCGVGIEMRHGHDDHFVRLRNDLKGITSLMNRQVTPRTTLKMTENRTDKKTQRANGGTYQHAPSRRVNLPTHPM